MNYKRYEIEREGQIDFFKNYGIPYDEDSSILVDNTDGVYNGVLLEFKLSINNLNSTLFQAIKYLSRMRIKGESVPRTILLVDLNGRKAYQYSSEDYIQDIEKEYVGAASKDNKNFVANNLIETFDYKDMMQSNNLKKLLKNKKSLEEMYIPINIDETCIVGWAERYYREKPKAIKGDFLGDDEGVRKITGEIREPNHFKGLINPYTEKTNVKFKYLMDCLNDRLQKKDLGAFYTPIPYCQKAAELVQMAVNMAIDAGKKDYIILDRCSGTGNLESALVGLYDKNEDEIISHTVVSTYEYYEYKVLNERLGDKVREIIPPTEADVIYSNGTVANADAMSEEYINNPIIKQYLDDNDCAIIMFENPPYRDETTDLEKRGKRKTFVATEMRKEVKGVATNELANQFIWSAFKYYLRQSTDSYIAFAPIKYWKQYDFINKNAKAGLLFNRKYFHATSSGITCICWENIESSKNKIQVEAYDIVDESIDFIGQKDLLKVENPVSRYYSKMKWSRDDEISIHCAANGEEAINKNITVKSYHRDDMIGYLESSSFTMGPMHRNLTRLCLFRGHGCYLTKKEYINILPIWVAKHIPLDNWYDKDIYATTSDGGDAYTRDQDFLKSCLIYTCLSNQNKCLSFTGSDGRYYKNELCFEEGTLARKDLEKYTLDATEKELIELWDQILNRAKKTDNYDSSLTYGVYQITKDLNNFEKVKVGKTTKNVYDYPELNGDLETLRVKLKEYYKTHIWDKMFQYELVK
ncbi:MAG: hypothetical protein E6053_04305 [Finegoldia magna]|uniref:hypothetical protein n=1 Tax=Finegoldia magna TaxID=1260 RepID=UPI0029083EBC|nr:hypothetical protein [Finegoldia magna]MDU5526683.1 hypothetical protein [Finegoldia magna]